MITERVKNTIINNNLIEKGEHIVIGLSGGPDSVCLFHILYRLREELDIRLHAVHINHGLRPGAADEDQRYAEALCAEYQVPCHSFSFDVSRIAKEEGISSEDAGRQVRYRSFFEVAGRIAAQTGAPAKIAVAQNMNDQAETILMRILRGTGTDGLAGIEYLRTEKGKGVVIRPLLDVTREEIEGYCRENNLDPRIDLTNLEPVYTRNKIRLELLPYLSGKFNPNITSALNRLSKIAKEDKEYFSQRVDEIIAEHAVFAEDGLAGTPGSPGNSDRSGNPGNSGKSGNPGRVAVPLGILCGERPAVRHRLIIKLFESIGLSKDITASHLEQADRLLQEKKTSAAADFTAGYAMRISYDTAEFYKKTEPQSMDFEYEININKEGVIEIPELNAEIGVKIHRRQDLPEFKRQESGRRAVCRLSLDRMEAAAETGGLKPVLRTRRQGDYIVPLGMQGRKKLQDFFVDEKCPAQDRDRVPLFCLGPEVIWAAWPAGGRISENFKVEDSTGRIILLEYSSKI